MSHDNPSFSGIADSQLVQAAQSGREDAFAELVRRHRSASLQVAAAILRNREEAEDEVQNAMYKAFKHLDQFKQESQFSTWLRSILLNQCFMRLRQLRRASLVHLDSTALSDSLLHDLGLLDVQERPDQKIAREQMAAILDGEIRRIPSRFRAVILLRDIQQLPMPSVAEKLGVTVSAAKSRLVRARVELKLRLTQRFGSDGAALPSPLCSKFAK